MYSSKIFRSALCFVGLLQRRLRHHQCTTFRFPEISKGSVRHDVNFQYSYDEHIQKEILRDHGKLIELEWLEWHNLKNMDAVCSLAPKRTAKIAFMLFGRKLMCRSHLSFHVAFVTNRRFSICHLM
jgi:hypothetical protein